MYIRKECLVIANSASGYWFCSGSAISCILDDVSKIYNGNTRMSAGWIRWYWRTVVV